MEALGAVASIIAVVQLTGTIINLCKKYLTSVADLKHDLNCIIIEVSTLRSILELVETAVEGEGGKSPILDALKTPVSSCQNVLADLMALLRSTQCEIPDEQIRMRDKASKILWRVEWPFKGDRAKTMLADLSQHKNAIAMILAADSSWGVRVLRLNVKELMDDLQDTKRSELLSRLVSTSPAGIHVEASDRHNDQTCLWLLEWQAWKQWQTPRGPRCIWIYGIPGAGKTVLASFLILNVQAFCQRPENPATGWSYYYCSHINNQDETYSFLRWILSQLCRQAQFVPPQLLKHDERGYPLTMTVLIEALELVCKRFRQIFIVIDAVEESRNAHLLAMLLRRLVTDPRFSNLHVAITSRQDVEISRSIDDVSYSICMSSVEVISRDIQRYIQDRLSNDPKFRRWPSSLTQEIQMALESDAKGMFRWVACQLDVLRLLNTENSVRKAIKTLPKTLEQTYERVLLAVPSDSRDSVVHAFAYLTTPLDLPPGCRMSGCLRSVLMILNDKKDDEESFDNFLCPDSLEELCTCLIHVAKSRDEWTGEALFTYSYAHFTVREYLFSEGIRKGPAASFRLTQARTDKLMIKAVMKCLIHLDTAPSIHFDWRSFCITNGMGLLSRFQSSITEDEELFRLSCRLFSPERIVLPWYKALFGTTTQSHSRLWGPDGPTNSTTISWLGLSPGQEITRHEMSLHTISNMLGFGFHQVINAYMDKCDENDIAELLSTELSTRDGKIGLLELSVGAGNHDLAKRVQRLLDYRPRKLLTDS
ncbi:hypothetical protein BHE90_012058 [Fusarium euwallaceae]|uniref:Nephrocystin 3-like N-terminal domain-containing protein n=2 Tax=Fusarium solani species complex TaxID=232080 RepID=A0A3M2R8M2_9HYPO|nr:hypothetical protein CDV36_015687 [Fusarium kuroshium]RTE73535.1 hypothetical protein BHE90_012058 [Fusarium euwallaceae]